MNQNIAVALKCIASVLILDLLCFFIFLSFNVIAVGLGTEPAGYVAYYNDEDGKPQELYTHYYSDGDDLKLEEYKDKGFEVQTSTFRTEVSPKVDITVKVLTGVFTLIILFSMIYTTLWARGDKDNNLATFGHIERDRWRGLKIGIMAVSPFAVLYLLLIICKFTEFIPNYLGIFRLANYYLFPLCDIAFGTAKSVSEVPVWGILLLVISILLVPAIAAFGYHCGNNEISLHDKLVYSKNKEKK